MKALLISDFNLQNLAAYLRAGDDSIAATVTPFGQATQTLLERDPALWSPDLAFAVVWTQPDSALPSFRARVNRENVPCDDVLREVDAYAGLLQSAAAAVPALLVPTWVIPTHHLGHGLADLCAADGPARLLMAANLRLCDLVRQTPNIYPLWTQKWIELSGPSAFSPRLWYSAKSPFGNDVFQHAAADIRSAIRGLRGQARKLVVVDLDDTLWGGIVGEVGWQALQLGGHDPVGESLVDFQRALKALSRTGVALAIVSKNEEATALEAIQRHPEMQLKLDDFAGYRINWDDKARNLADLTAELNLGLDSVVFLDDSPTERARIREAYPQVLVPELPADKRLYTQTLLSLTCFDKPSVTAEDISRTQLYAEERKRRETRTAARSIDDWIAGLGMQVTVSALTPANLSRVAQLLNKTNQMNLSTRRMSEGELRSWAAAPGHEIWAVRVCDRFGDAGITGVLGLEFADTQATICDFVLSCRVMGRRIEETLLAIAAERARVVGAGVLSATFRPTAKNQPCLLFLRRSGLTERTANVFEWNAAIPYRSDSAIAVTYEDAAAPSPSTAAMPQPGEEVPHHV